MLNSLLGGEPFGQFHWGDEKPKPQSTLASSQLPRPRAADAAHSDPNFVSGVGNWTDRYHHLGWGRLTLSSCKLLVTTLAKIGVQWPMCHQFSFCLVLFLMHTHCLQVCTCTSILISQHLINGLGDSHTNLLIHLSNAGQSG